MSERKHQAEGGETKVSVRPGTKTSHQAAHPILQLQQTIGNKAVTNLIQRHPDQAVELVRLKQRYEFTRMSNIFSHQRIDEHETNHS